MERTKEEVRKMAKLVTEVNDDSTLKCPFISRLKRAAKPKR